MSFAQSLKKLNHHAYYMVGDAQTHSDLIEYLTNTFQIKTRGNPDFLEKTFASLTIDESRQIKSFHETLPVDSAGKKIIILSIHSATTEAQNALLKLLEEPSSYAHFFLIVPSTHILLPTIKSR